MSVENPFPIVNPEVVERVLHCNNAKLLFVIGPEGWALMSEVDKQAKVWHVSHELAVQLDQLLAGVMDHG